MNWGFPESTEFWNLLRVLLDWIPFFWQTTLLWILVVISVTSPTIVGGSPIVESRRFCTCCPCHWLPQGNQSAVMTYVNVRNCGWRTIVKLVTVYNECFWLRISLPLIFGGRTAISTRKRVYLHFWRLRESVWRNGSKWQWLGLTLVVVMFDVLYFGLYATQKMGVVFFSKRF